MPIDRRTARSEILRMSGLRRYPLTDEGLRSAIDALQRWSDSAKHAALVVDEWLSDATDFPTPTEIRNVALAHRAGPVGDPSEGCTVCKGAGSVLVIREIAGERYHGAKICACRRVAAR